MIEVGASLVPVADYHHVGCAGFRPHWGDLHGVIEIVCEVVLGKPIACLP
jgi:hypothetical protein